MLMITGANGQLGRLVVEEVLRRDPGQRVAVSVRDPRTVNDLAERGVEIRQGDYDDPASMSRAFRDVSRLLLMPAPTSARDGTGNQLMPVVRAVADSEIEHVVYPGAREVPGLEMPLLTGHARIVDAIRRTGVATTLLANAIYVQFIAGDVASAVTAGELAAPAGDAVVAPVLRSDLAAATAAVLVDPVEHVGRTYELTGADAVSWSDLAELAGVRAGRVITYRSVDRDEAAVRLRGAGLPEPVVLGMLGFYDAYRAGWSATPTGDIERLAGRAPRPTLEAIAAFLDGAAS